MPPRVLNGTRGGGGGDLILGRGGQGLQREDILSAKSLTFKWEAHKEGAKEENVNVAGDFPLTAYELACDTPLTSSASCQ